MTRVSCLVSTLSAHLPKGQRWCRLRVLSTGAIALLVVLITLSVGIPQRIIIGQRGERVPAEGSSLDVSKSEDNGRDIEEWIRSIHVKVKVLHHQLQETPHAPSLSNHGAAAGATVPRYASASTPTAGTTTPPQQGQFWGKPRRTSVPISAEGQEEIEWNDALAAQEDDPTPHQQALPSVPLKNVSTIFVSMASFRDSHCEATLVDMFAKAAVPSRIFVGLVEQAEPLGTPHYHAWHDAACIGAQLRAICSATKSDKRTARSFCPLGNIRVRRTTSQEARGPTFGRFVAATMYQGESYFMMIDAHNKFIAGWDEAIIGEYQRTVELRTAQREAEQRIAAGSAIPSDRGAPPPVLSPRRVVLSHYPASYATDMSIRPGGRETFMRLMCSGHFLENGIFRLDADAVRTPSTPLWQPFTAAGFLFADALLLTEVPFDPHLDFLFDGEEILYSARVYTYGWDSYLPTINILYHHYGRPNSPKVWSVPGNLWWMHQKASMVRVLSMLHQAEDYEKLERSGDLIARSRIHAETEVFGMGPARSVESFWKQAGVDPHTRKHLVTGGARAYCQQLAHVSHP
jgi:hypothetical protein